MMSLAPKAFFSMGPSLTCSNSSGFPPVLVLFVKLLAVRSRRGAYLSTKKRYTHKKRCK